VCARARSRGCPCADVPGQGWLARMPSKDLMAAPARVQRKPIKQIKQPSGPDLPQCSPAGVAAARQGCQGTREHHPDAWPSPRSGPGSPHEPLGEAGGRVDGVAADNGDAAGAGGAGAGGADAAGGLADAQLVVKTADLDVGASRGEASVGEDEMARAAEQPPAACPEVAALANSAPSSAGDASHQEDCSACSTQPCEENVLASTSARLAATRTQESFACEKLAAVGPEPAAAAAGESTRSVHDTHSQSADTALVSDQVQEDANMALRACQAAAASITWQDAEGAGAAFASCAAATRRVELESAPGPCQAPRPPGFLCASEGGSKGPTAGPAWTSEGPALA